MLVNAKRDQNTDHSFQESKWHIKADQTLKDGFHAWNDCLICSKDCFLWHKVVIKRIYNEVIGYNGNKCHYNCSSK